MSHETPLDKSTVMGPDRTRPLLVDVETIHATIAAVRAKSRARLVHDEVALLHLALRGHLAVLLDEGRGLAEKMPRGSFDRSRMEIHLQRLTALHARPIAPSAGAAYSGAQQLARGCEWLLAQLDADASA
ncbi:DUF6415 family natural product biosynthesis protein [Streptomyces sp. NPDC059740]|uniref:DUF6415 family natural product biosynthesis protein n=1 Tax=Streptomyces sp. NPDC059740 TaxID=3346926 RepID=UPI00365B13DC